MKKIIYAILPAVMLASACKKDLTSINKDPKNPITVPYAAPFTQAERVFVNTVTSSNVNLNTFRLIVQHWNETTYTDESNYNLSTSRAITDNMWNALYRDVLENFEQSKTLNTAQNTNPAATKVDNAEADILEVYAYYYLVTTYGNIPYTKALNPNNLFPSYDDAATVYNSLLTRLDADIAALAGGTGSLGSADVIYGGSATKWTKFANTLKLKMGITIADADNAKAKSVIESAVAGGVFTSNSDNAFFAYLSAPPNTNPVWVDLVQSGRLDFIGASTLVNQLKSNSDPRLPLFFTVDNKGGYSGQTPGSSASYANFSAPSPTLTAPSFRGVLLDYSETEFALAEAAARGYNVGGTAESHYNAGITANILDWGGSATAATTYIAQPSVAYTTAVSATATYKQKIGLQKWIAYYNRGYDAWIAQRLLDYPYMVPPTKALSDYPVRFTYPVNEGNVNGANVKAAGQAIGGDLVTTKLWFDKADQVKP